MSITVRSCTIDYQIQEHFIGIRECKEGVSEKALFDLVQDTMARCMFDKESLLACALDGASAMVKLGGMLNDYTGGQSLYIHCLAHCCDLVKKDVISTCISLQSLCRYATTCMHSLAYHQKEFLSLRSFKRNFLKGMMKQLRGFKVYS